MSSPIVGREMIKAGGGEIINLASQAGVIALNRHVAHCSSKGGIIMLTRVLALEWTGHGDMINGENLLIDGGYTIA